MLGTSISDVEFCKKDLEKCDEDFIREYPIYNNSDLSENDQRMLENIKTDLLILDAVLMLKQFFLQLKEFYMQ